MTSKKGDGPSDHAESLCASGQPSADESVEGISRDVWSKADFLHKAQVLVRRLAGWHIDDDGPVWTPKRVDFLREVERPFRFRVMLGEHEPKKRFSSPIRLLPIAPEGDFENNFAGQAVTLYPDEYRKDLTIWLFRDFYEHLGQLGDSEVERLLRLKVEQLLDSRMYRRAHSEAFGDYIAGHPVDQSLLDEMVEAAKLGFGNTSHPRNCNTCGQPLIVRDYDRSECHECRSSQGKLADLYVAIHAKGDAPDRIREWPTIRAFLRDAFGPDRTNEQLWELMTDRLRVDGWEDERWLRTRYGEFVALLKSGLLNGRTTSTKDDSVKSSTVESGEPALPTKPMKSHSLEECKPSERQAYYSYKLAEARAERRLEDREAYDLLVEGDWSEHFTGELADYQLPTFSTWARQLRTSRKATNERKYTSRTHQ